MVRHKQIWEQVYRAWRHCDLSDSHYVYLVADGIYSLVRLGIGPLCVLMPIGATGDVCREPLAIVKMGIEKASCPGKDC